MDLIYPKVNSKIFVPRELSGQSGNTVFEVAHRNPKAIVYCHLDGDFIGTTQKSHRLAFAPTSGQHILTLVDESGETLVRSFRVLSGKGFFFSSRRRHTRCGRDWSSDVCSSDLRPPCPSSGCGPPRSRSTSRSRR